MSKESVFAARISPIARFTGESPVSFVQKYSKLFSGFFDLSKLTGILEGSAEYASEHALMNRALELAASETDISLGMATAGKNLASVFSRLTLTENQKKRSEFYHYNLLELSPENAFPKLDASIRDRKPLVTGFYKEMDALQENPPKDYQSFQICFGKISQQYMWCFTASDYEGEDISLYDYMKVTEAIMVCLVKSDNGQQPYTMVTGDFSGIQKYIFAIASANHKGVAKRLRARSFFVDIISKVFSQYVVDACEVGRANILLQTGGKFYCIVPTTADIDLKLTAVRNKFDAHLYETFHGTVSVNMAWMSLEDKDIEFYSDTIVKLNNLLGEQKAKPFEGILQNEKKWNEDAFVLCDDLGGKHLCKDCGMELIDSERSSCDMCNMQLQIGGELPKTRYIVYSHEKKSNAYKIFDNYYIQLENSEESNAFEGAYLIEVLNDAPIPSGKPTLPCIRKYMANHIPTQNGEPKTFDMISKESGGMDKLAVLKADVDVLGFIFAQGLRTKERHFGTISRVNTMSRMLEVFFSGYINTLLTENKAYKDVYAVFSGGDDLFLIGPWDVMMELAIEIQKKFREFVAQNGCVTMSAAISLFHNKEHIAFMAEYSEEQLKRAKNEAVRQVYPNRTGRNAICVMGDLFSWGDFAEQFSYVKELVRLLDKKVDVGILRRLSKYSEMYRQYLLEEDTWQLRFEPLFYYDRQRNYTKFNSNQEDSKHYKWFASEYVKPMGNASDPKRVNKNLYFAQTIVKIALNKTRKERK